MHGELKNFIPEASTEFFEDLLQRKRNFVFVGLKGKTEIEEWEIAAKYGKYKVSNFCGGNDRKFHTNFRGTRLFLSRTSERHEQQISFSRQGPLAASIEGQKYGGDIIKF